MPQFALNSLLLSFSLSAACGSSSNDTTAADTTVGLAPGETPKWEPHVAPLLGYSCGGCHSDVAKSGSCVGISCFIDDPCELGKLGCCTAEEPFLSCEDRAEDPPDGETRRYTIAECGVMRMKLAFTMAKAGRLDDMQPPRDDGSAQGSAQSAAMGFLNFEGPDAFDEADMAMLEAWLATGTDLPPQCAEPSPSP